MKSDVLVIGGGVIGACCAYSLAKKGARVTLLEKGHFGSGASGCSAAMLECQTHAYRGDQFLSLAKPSMDLFPGLYQELKELTGIDFEYEKCGILNLAMSEEEAAFFISCVIDQKRREFRARWMEPAEIEKEFSQINPEYFGGAFYLEDGQINGEKFLLAALQAARQKGVELRENLKSLTFQQESNRIEVRTAEGNFEASAYVLAAGAWSDEVLEPLRLSLGIKPIRGQLLYYDTPSDYLPAPIFTQCHGYVVPKRSGYTLVGTTAEEAGFNQSTTAGAQAELAQKGRYLVPGLARRSVRGGSAGLRPKSPDDYPVIGPLPGYENVLMATGHFRNGMLLAPITADLIGSLVFKERPRVNTAPFSPVRLVQRLAD